MNLLILCFHFINMIRAGSARWCPAFDGRSYISDQKRNYLAADKVPRAFFFREFYDDFVLFFLEFSVLFTCGSIWIKIFTASPLTQTKRQTSVLYDVQGAESEPIIVCRCLERPTTTRFFALPLKLIPPVSIDFTAVYSPSTCYWHVSVSLISFI